MRCFVFNPTSYKKKISCISDDSFQIIQAVTKKHVEIEFESKRSQELHEKSFEAVIHPGGVLEFELGEIAEK